MRESVNGQRWVFAGFMSWLNDVNSWPDNECASWCLPTTQSVKVVFQVCYRIPWVCRLASIVGRIVTSGSGFVPILLRWTRWPSQSGNAEKIETIFTLYKVCMTSDLREFILVSAYCHTPVCPDLIRLLIVWIYACGVIVRYSLFLLPHSVYWSYKIFWPLRR